jgi:ribosomal protein L37AE/L43A
MLMKEQTTPTIWACASCGTEFDRDVWNESDERKWHLMTNIRNVASSIARLCD